MGGGRFVGMHLRFEEVSTCCSAIFVLCICGCPRQSGLRDAELQKWALLGIAALLKEARSIDEYFITHGESLNEHPFTRQVAGLE